MCGAPPPNQKCVIFSRAANKAQSASPFARRGCCYYYFYFLLTLIATAIAAAVVAVAKTTTTIIACYCKLLGARKALPCWRNWKISLQVATVKSANLLVFHCIWVPLCVCGFVLHALSTAVDHLLRLLFLYSAALYDFSTLCCCCCWIL